MIKALKEGQVTLIAKTTDMAEYDEISITISENTFAINYKEKDEQCDLDIVPNELRNAQLNIVMSNSLGFGGHNASIIIKKFEEEK